VLRLAARLGAALPASLALALVAGCAASPEPEARGPAPVRRPATPLEGASVEGAPIETYLGRRAALLVAGAVVTATAEGVNIQAPGGGAAVAVARDGYLLAAAHSVEGARIHLYLFGDEVWFTPARVVWLGDRKRSPFLDLALVKVDVPLPGSLAWASPADVASGADLVGVAYRRAPEGIALDVEPGRALGALETALAEEPRVSTVLHDLPLGDGEGGGAITTREGRLVGIHLGSIDLAGFGKAGIAARPDPAWLARRIEADRRARGAKGR
jgi:hypothetical protein